MEEEKSVVILAAGKINQKLSFVKPLFSNPGLLPINSHSTLYYIISFYAKIKNVRIYIVTDENGISELKKEPYLDSKLIEFIVLKQSNGVVHSLEQAIKRIKVNTSIIVNVVTTIPNVFLKKNQVFLNTTKETHKQYYSLINIDNLQNVKFINKYDDILIQEGNAFTGIFHADINEMRNACKKLKNKTDLLDVVKLLHKNIQLNYVLQDWNDIGHEINYFKTRKKLITSRAINNFQYESGMLIKESKSDEKLFQESDYIKHLPFDLQIYFPRVFHYEKTKSQTSKVYMEYYPFPNLSEYQLFWDIDNFEWSKVYDMLKEILTKFKKVKHSFGYHAFEDFMYNKTKDRIKEFAHQSKNKYLFNDTLYINGNEYANWNLISEKVKDRIRSLYNEDDFCIVHGDFCFNNILYDRIGENIKLIDVRGNYGTSLPGIYGDFKYDLAKLMHSSSFHYDYIVNNLYTVTANKNHFEYKFIYRNNFEHIKQLGNNLINDFKYTVKDIQFIVGLLFVSMCPFHYDDTNRQTVMYLQGIQILNNNL